MEAGPGPWESLSFLVKVILYIGMIATIGAAWMRALQHSYVPSEGARALSAYQVTGAALGLAAALLYFLLQVGGITLQGWRGMFDPDMAAVLGASSVGRGTRFRAIGFFVALLAAVPLFLGAPQTGIYRFIGRLAVPLTVIAALLLAASFAVTGHTVTMSATPRIAVGLHVIAVSLWAGSLYPLFRLTRHPGPRVAPLMHQFGHFALFVVGLFLLSGLVLLVQMFDSPVEVVRSVYGRLLLLKLLLVALVIGVGALNKFRLVPALEQGGKASALQASIGIEILLVLGILAVTAWITTVTGPPAGM